MIFTLFALLVVMLVSLLLLIGSLASYFYREQQRLWAFLRKQQATEIAHEAARQARVAQIRAECGFSPPVSPLAFKARRER